MSIVNKLPLRYWRLDQNLNEASGAGTVATRVGVQRYGIGLTSKSLYSQYLDSTKTLAFVAPVYRENARGDSFTICTTIYIIKYGSQRVFSKVGELDGIYLNADNIVFGTKYLTAGDAMASYKIDNNAKLDVVGVHTPTKNSLFVNGSLVAEVDITPAQQADAYKTEGTTFNSGNTDVGQVLINDVAVFNRALQKEEILYIYNSNNERQSDAPESAYGGEAFYFSQNYRYPYLNENYNSEVSWSTGEFSNVSIQAPAIAADKVNDLTVAGRWETAIDLYTGENATLVQAVNLTWVGRNVSVETSPDGTTWTTATSGVNLTNFPANFNPLNKSLRIRINFAEGLAESYIRNLEVRAYNSATTTNIGQRTVTYTNAVNMKDTHPMELRSDWGVAIPSGSISFAADASETAINPLTVEIWLKRGAAAPVLSFTPTSTYVNAVSGSANVLGEWALYHYTVTTAPTTLTISNVPQVGKVTLYPTALTVAQILNIYKAYTGKDISTLASGDAIGMTETGSAPLTYAYDWAVLGA